MRDKGTLKYHGPCQACGSKDNKAVYEHDNGELSAYCFGCGDYAVEDNPVTSNKKENNMSLETVIEVNDYPIRGFKDRCITKNVADKYGVKVGYSEEDGSTIQYHYYPTTRNNKVIGYSRREVSTKKFIAIGDTKNDVQLFGQSLFQQGAKKLIITEGELDAMSVQQMYANKNNEYPVVSITNGVGGAKKQIASNLDWINSFEEIIFMFDADEVGKNAASDCASSKYSQFTCSTPISMLKQKMREIKSGSVCLKTGSLVKQVMLVLLVIMRLQEDLLITKQELMNLK